MRHARSLFGWAFFLGLLAAVGLGVFHFVRYRPRCVIAGPLVVRHLSADGSQLRTLGVKDGYKLFGPAQIWDTHSGALVQEILGDVEIRDDDKSNDGRYLAVGLRDHTLRIVDWHAGREMPVDKLPDVRMDGFSPKGRWLFAHANPKSHFIIEVATGKTVLHVDSGQPFFSSDDRLLFTPKFAWDLEKNEKVPAIQVGDCSCSASPDGRWLLIRRRSELQAAIDPSSKKALGVDVWDLKTFQRAFHRDLAREGTLHSAFSPDGRLLALWLGGEGEVSDLEMFDTATGKLLWAYPMIC